MRGDLAQPAEPSLRSTASTSRVMATVSLNSIALSTLPKLIRAVLPGCLESASDSHGKSPGPRKTKGFLDAAPHAAELK
jgi:hypothetical protein